MNIFERAGSPIEGIRTATTFPALAEFFRQAFGLVGAVPVSDPTEYKSDGSDYGLKVRGKKAREDINSQVKEIIGNVENPEKLTPEQRDLLLQYSGRGGTSDNSQYEYYTPTFVAQGVWDAMKANGFGNGNVCEPSCGAGVFVGTKPEGVVVSGNDLDPVGSKVAALLNPEDSISNAPFEEIAANTPDETFDGIVGNVPFGNARGKSAHLDPTYKNIRLIERYFLLRSLDKVKPGGLCCLVVPTNIVGNTGKAWEEFRVAVSKKAEFLGAHKLPSKTFGAQGTDTVVDVAVFKKHPKDLLDKVDSLETQALWDSGVLFKEFIKGKYWQGEGKPYIMGKYTPKVAGDRWSREAVDGDIDNEAIKAKLAHRFKSRIDWAALNSAEPRKIAYVEGDRRVINGAMHEFSAGRWIKVEESKIGSNLSKSKFGAESVEELRGLLGNPLETLSLKLEQGQAILDEYPQLLSQAQKDAIQFAAKQPPMFQEQLFRGALIGGMIARMKAKFDEGEDVSAERESLQNAVVSEIEHYGHPKNNKALVLSGEGSRMFGMFSNSVDEQGNFSALLAGTLERAQKGNSYNPVDPEAVISHLFVREGLEDIELEDFLKLYSGKREIKSLGDLAEFPGIAITPSGNIMPMGRYCSGDIYPKIADLQHAMGGSSDPRVRGRMQEQIDEMLRKVKKTAPEDITFGLQQKWFNRQLVAEFLRENGYPNVQYGKVTKREREDYSGKMVEVEDFDNEYSGPEGEFTGLPTFGFFKQFEKYLNGGNVTSSKQENIEEYREQSRALEEQFNFWMQQRSDIDEIAAEFNRKFNGHIPLDYEGESLDIDEFLSGEITPHGYQNAEVRRLSEEGRGICGFGVGLGKSYTSLALAVFDIKKGRSKRKCIVVPASVLVNWYHESRTIYSESFMRDSVFFVGLEPKFNKDGDYIRKPVKDEKGQPKTKEDGTPILQDDIVIRNSKQDTFEAMWKIPQSNSRLVVMTKEKFGMIPLRPETKSKYTDKMVSNALMSEGLAKKISGGKKSYNDDKKISSIEQKYSDEGTQKKGELPFLEDMGFDSIVVDEVHNYKNSFEPGKSTRGIAYLPTAPSANIALDMAMKSHWLREQNGGRGFVGLSATPVTNSPFEIFNQLSLCCDPEEFQSFGVHSVDDFVRVFGNLELVDKMKINGEVARMEGLVGFQNLDGLRTLFNKYVNLKTVKDVDSEIYVPEGVEHQEDVDLDAEQQEAYSDLRKRAKKALDPSTPAKDKEHVFSIIREMDRATTDMDLYNRTMTFVLPKEYMDKVKTIEKSLPKTYTIKVRDEDSGEIFTDTSIFAATYLVDGDNFRFIVPDSYEDLFLAKCPGHGVDLAKITHPVTPKYAKMIERMKADLETEGKQIVFTEEKTQHQKVKRLIMHHLGLTDSEIGVINADDAKGNQLDNISKAYNAGAIKVVIANKKAEVGVNLQKGTTAIHHLTLPWTPASIEQRNGRGVRQGNKVDHVKVFYYCGKMSFDAYRKELLKAKANWINDLFTGEAVTALNGDATSGDEMMDMLAENAEEARAQRQSRLAEEKRKREERFSEQLVNKFQVLLSNSLDLANLDRDKTADKNKSREKVQDAAAKVTRTEELIAAQGETEELNARLSRQKSQLAKEREKLETLDSKYEIYKQTLESKIKQGRGYLSQQGKEGKLPFDLDLVENPINATADIFGRLYQVGKTYEAFDREGTTVAIFKVDSIDHDDKAVRLTRIIGKRGFSGYTKLHEIKGGIKPCSYSTKEIAAKQIEASSGISYGDLLEMGLDKQGFAELNEVIKEKLFSYKVAILEANGQYLIERPDSAPEGWTIPFPDPQNSNFKKGVLSVYLENKRKSSYRFYDIRRMVSAVFGPDLDSLAAEFSLKATESEVREKSASLMAGRLAMFTFETAKEELDYLTNSKHTLLAYMRDRLLSLGDNHDEIMGIAKQTADGHEANVRKKVEAEQRIEAEKTANVLPAEMAKKFLDIGVIVKPNFKDASLKWKRYVNEFPALSRWWFQDKTPMQGPLYEKKNDLKADFEAKFTKDWDENPGAWWHVDSKHNLDEIFNLLNE